MNRLEVETKLNELRNYEIVRFTMQEGLIFDIPYKYIKNYPSIEMIEAIENNFRCFYCSIISINPCP